MKMAVLHKLNAPLVVEEVSVPDALEGQALVKVVASGVCHTQLLEIQGKRGPDPHLPHGLGHEGAGVVEAIGPGVTRVRPGDHVIISWIKGPGLNAQPAAYRNGNLLIKAGLATTFCEQALISENRLTPIRKDMPLDMAALLGCAVPTGAGIILNTAKTSPGNSVAVFGIGGIGLNVLQAAAYRKAGKVIAVDIHDHKLNQARVFGATHVVNARKEDPVQSIFALTNGEGADCAVEAVGLIETMEQAYRCVRKDTGLTILAGNLPHQVKISIDPFDLICGKRIIGTWGGETRPEKDLPLYADLYLSGKLKLAEMVTHRFHLNQINEALEALAKGDVGRALIVF